jgi:ABC-2 type transport system permease protein
MTSLAPRTPTVTAAKSIPTYFRLLLRGQLTRGRLFGLGVLGGISFLLAIVVRTAVESRDLEEASVRLLSDYSIGLLIPLATLILGSPMIGDLVEDRLLVYLWLKPVPRWHLAVAAYAAVVATLLPVVIVPVLLTALIVPATVASILGVLAYSGIYLFLGARFTAGLWLGLLYLVLWENVLARFSNGMARLSLRSYLQTMLQRGTDVSIDLADRAAWASIVIPLAVAAFAVAMAAVTLATKDID